MTPCPVEESPFSKANTGTVRFQTHFVEFLSTRSGLRCPKTTPKCGMTHHLQISSSQLAAGVVRTDSIWEMSGYTIIRSGPIMCAALFRRISIASEQDTEEATSR